MANDTISKSESSIAIVVLPGTPGGVATCQTRGNCDSYGSRQSSVPFKQRLDGLANDDDDATTKTNSGRNIDISFVFLREE